MSDISQISLGGTDYNIKDTTARAQINSANTRINTLNNTITNTSSNLTENINKVDDKVDTLQIDFNGLQTTVSSIGTKVNEIDGELTTVSENLDNKRDNAAPSSTNWHAGTPIIEADGSMNIGNSLLFHTTSMPDSGGINLKCPVGGTINTVNLPSSPGTLALTSDIPTPKVVYLIDSTNTAGIQGTYSITEGEFSDYDLLIIQIGGSANSSCIWAPYTMIATSNKFIADTSIIINGFYSTSSGTGVNRIIYLKYLSSTSCQIVDQGGVAGMPNNMYPTSLSIIGVKL